MWILRFYFWPFGRLSRAGMWIGGFIVPIVFTALAAGIDYKFSGFDPTTVAGNNHPASVPAMTAVGWLFFWPEICLSVKRFHDLDRSGWHYFFWYLASYVCLTLSPAMFGGELDPIFELLPKSTSDFVNRLPMLIQIPAAVFGGLVSIALLVITLFLGGTGGPNKYGPDPRDRVGIQRAAA